MIAPMNTVGRVFFVLFSFLFAAVLAKSQNTEIVVSPARERQHTDGMDCRKELCGLERWIEGDLLALCGQVHVNEFHQRRHEVARSTVNNTIRDSIAGARQASVGGRSFGVVNMSVANLRAKPAETAELMSQAILGTPLTVLKKEHGWYYVESPDEYAGWISDGIELMSRDDFAVWTARPKVIVTSEFGFTRAAQEDTAQVVSDIVVGALLALIKEAGAYYQVQYPDGRVAFLSRRDGQLFSNWLEKAEDTPGNIVATAKRFIGIPYLWGGTSSKAFDCSGFTKTVYYLNGVLLPRDAGQQALVGDPVEPGPALENLRVADLLFFGSKANGEKGERVTHVGIYLGDKKFIHASGDVRINSFLPSHADYSAHHRKSFLQARRIIGADEHAGVRKLSRLPYYGKHGF
jgi:cell wall-associated NlpC family hydrolase